MSTEQVRTEEASFAISFPIDLWTHFRAMRAVTNRLWGTWVVYVFFLGLPSLLLIMAFFLEEDVSNLRASGLSAWTILFILLLGSVFIFVFIPLVQLWQIWAVRRRNQVFRGVQHQTFTADGFLVSGDSFNTSLKWNAFLKARETKRFFLLYLNPRYAYFVPKEKIATSDDLEKLRTVLKTYL